MKKLIFISLLVISFCKAADDKKPSMWERFTSKFKKKEDDTMMLDLSGSQLSTFPPKAQLSPKLTDLNLSDNQIGSMPEALDIYLKKLRSLSLSNNMLKEIPCAMPKLQYLDLSCNRINEIIAALFHYPKLIELNLSNNQLEYFDPEILKSTPNLTFLDLSGNPLSSKQNIEDLKKAAEKRSIELHIGDFEGRAGALIKKSSMKR